MKTEKNLSQTGSPEQITSPAQETIQQAPVVKSPEALARFRSERIQQLEQMGADIAREGAAQVNTSIVEMGLSPEDVAAAKQEGGYEVEMAALQAEQAALIKEAKVEIAKVAGDLKNEEPSKDLHLEAVLALKKQIPKLTDQTSTSFIETFNAAHAEVMQDMKLTLVQSDREKIVIVDETGRLRELSLTKENAMSTLQEIKRLDEVLGRKGGSYELRQEILKRSGGEIKTFEAYTYGTEKPKDLQAFLDNSENWTPERRIIQEQIVAGELEKALDLSKRMGDPEGAIFALRGNTAAGKTTSLRENALFSSAINPTTKQPDGAINPDTYKSKLKNSEVGPDGWISVTNQQTHTEGSMIARRMVKTIQETRQASLIIDKRLNETKDVNELLVIAEKTGRQMKFLDVDAPLAKSLIGVLSRKAGEDDPLVPFDAVVDGYRGVKKNRIDLVRQAISEERISTYVLYAPGPDGKPLLIAEKNNGKFVVHDKDRFSEAVGHQAVEPTVEALRSMVINDENIEKLLASFSERDRAYSKGILESYKNKGQTFEQVLNRHAREMNGANYYTSQAQRNLELTSRTAKGVVDTTASKDKAGKMSADLTPDVAAERAKANVKSANEELFAHRDHQFTNSTELRGFIEGIAAKVNQGILKEGESVIRGGLDSEKYPYTRVADLEPAMARFYDEFQQRLMNPDEDPVELAAWAEYHIDMEDHFFADGCGKMSKAVSGFVLMRARLPLPTYTSRDEYYSYGRKVVRDPATLGQPDPELQAFTQYYKSLIKAV